MENHQQNSWKKLDFAEPRHHNTPGAWASSEDSDGSSSSESWIYLTDEMETTDPLSPGCGKMTES